MYLNFMYFFKKKKKKKKKKSKNNNILTNNVVNSSIGENRINFLSNFLNKKCVIYICDVVPDYIISFLVEEIQTLLIFRL